MLESGRLVVTPWARTRAREIVLEPPLPLYLRPVVEAVNFVTAALLPGPDPRPVRVPAAAAGVAAPRARRRRRRVRQARDRPGCPGAAAPRAGGASGAERAGGRPGACLPRRLMGAHVLERAQRVAAPPEEAFAAFADVRNLERMTPPWLRFRILTDHSVMLRPGALIQYRLTLHRFPVRWTTEIVEWEPSRRFVDVQRSGPYASWEHTHTFAPVEGGTLITDQVRYALPFGPLGALAHVAFVRRDLRRIFDFRRDATEALLGAAGAPAQAPARSA